MSLLEEIAFGLAVSGLLAMIFIKILECLCDNWELQRREALLRGPDGTRRMLVDEYDEFLTVLMEWASRPPAPSRVRTPSITNEENPPSMSERFGDVAEVHRHDVSPEASSPREGGPASSSPHHSKQVLSSPERKQALSYGKRRQASSSRERSRVSPSRERSPESSSREHSRVSPSREHSRASRKRQFESCSPDKMFERSSEPSVRNRRSIRIEAGSSSQPQPRPPTLLTEGGAYGTFDRSQEVQALSPSASRSSHTSSVTRPSRVYTATPSTSFRSSPSSQSRPIRAPAPLRESQTPPPTGPSRTTTPKELPQVPSSSESSRREVPERMSRISASAGSSRPLGRSLEEQLRSALSGGLQTTPPLSPRSSAKVKDETAITPSQPHGDSDEQSESDDVDVLMKNALLRIRDILSKM